MFDGLRHHARCGFASAASSWPRVWAWALEMTLKPCCVHCPAWRCASGARCSARALARIGVANRPEFAQVLHRCQVPRTRALEGAVASMAPVEPPACSASSRMHGSTKPNRRVFAMHCGCFALGYSRGGPISLVVPYDLASMRETWPAHLARGTLIPLLRGPGSGAGFAGRH